MRESREISNTGAKTWVMPKAASWRDTVWPIFLSSAGSKEEPRATPEGKAVVSCIRGPHRPSMWNTAGIWWGLFSITMVCSCRCQSAISWMVSQERNSRVLIWPTPNFMNCFMRSSMPLMAKMPTIWAIFSSRLSWLTSASARSRAVREVSM